MTESITREDILNHGIFKKSVYGICKAFKWLQYDYKGRRFNISQFNDDIDEVNKIYCQSCGNGYFPSYIKIVFGVHTCLRCAKQING